MTYALGIYGSMLTRAQKHVLEMTHRKVLLQITGAYRTTPYTSLCKIADIPPFEHLIEYHVNLSTCLNGNLSLLDLPRDRPLENKSSLSLSSRAENVIPITKIHPPDAPTETTFIAYTDGSKTTDGVGFGLVIYDNSGKIKHQASLPLFSYASIFQAECLAIIRTLELINSRICKAGESVHIFTDSQSIFTCLRSRLIQHPLIEQIREQIITTINKGIRINISWTKAHVGTIGNEKADQLAKAGIRAKTKINYVDVPRCFVKHQLKALAKTNTNKRLALNESKSIIPVLGNWNKDPYKLNLAKQTFQLISGHGPFPSYLKRFGLKEDEACLCGEPTANATHYLDDCPLVDQARTHFRIQTDVRDVKPSKFIGHQLNNDTEAINKFCKEVIRIIRKEGINR
ncbi:uncharacterized protein LOC128387410 [Panonychus citri]|uniref:uncharacterized protein LOC128387410 n=1 Tax=Panonychus citri TaxID=50023 RepID=UPI0023070BEF|nr:uncharacterized protein LOC128387410 [Panonychus citri]